MLTLRQERQMHKADWLYHMQYVSSVPTPFSFTCSWWSPPGSSLQLSLKGRRGMHLAGEMGVGTCWNFSNRAVLLGISLTQNNSVSDLDQVPFFPGQRALCSLCPIPWQALPSPPRASLPAATGGQGGKSSPPETSLCFLPFPRALPRAVFLSCLPCYNSAVR